MSYKKKYKKLKKDYRKLSKSYINLYNKLVELYSMSRYTIESRPSDKVFMKGESF